MAERDVTAWLVCPQSDRRSRALECVAELVVGTVVVAYDLERCSGAVSELDQSVGLSWRGAIVEALNLDGEVFRDNSTDEAFEKPFVRALDAHQAPIAAVLPGTVPLRYTDGGPSEPICCPPPGRVGRCPRFVRRCRPRAPSRRSPGTCGSALSMVESGLPSDSPTDIVPRSHSASNGTRGRSHTMTSMEHGGSKPSLDKPRGQ